MEADLVARVRGFAVSYPRREVSSAFLAAELGVSARAVAAAVRPFGVVPRRLAGDVRGYTVAELAQVGLEAPAAADGDEPSTLGVLSAGAGHDMTGALRAAGWLP